MCLELRYALESNFKSPNINHAELKRLIERTFGVSNITKVEFVGQKSSLYQEQNRRQV